MFAPTAQAAPSFQEKDRFLSSVINALNRQPALQASLAMANARTLRAGLYLDRLMLDEARGDVHDTLQEHPLHAAAYRILADVEKADGRTDHAIEALSLWGRVEPTMKTKVANEIAMLQQLQQEQEQEQAGTGSVDRGSNGPHP